MNRAAWRALVSSTMLWLAAGCGTQEPAAVSASGTGAAEASTVRLDAVSQREAGLRVDVIRERPLVETLRVTGRITINEDRTWRVGAITGGRVVSVFANAGDRVAEGHVLARLFSSDIHEAYAEYQKAETDVSRLRGALAFAKGILDRTARLHALKAASQQQVEQARAELLNAETAVAHGEVELKRARSHLVDYLKIPVAAAGQHDVAGGPDASIIPVAAPAAGTVLRRSVTPGTVVDSSRELFVITDLSSLWMMAAVDERNLAALRPGMPVRVFVQAYPDRPFGGRIGKVAEELDPTTRTVMARVDLPNTGGLLKPEMYATAEIELGKSLPAIWVPQGAIQEVSGHPVVFVRLAEDEFEVRAVELDRALDGNRVVTGGLRPGEAVVTAGSFILKSQLLKGALAQD